MSVNSNYTFKEFYYDVYRPHHSGLDAKTSESRETLMIKYVFDDIGNLPIQDIHAYNMNDFLRRLPENNSLSESTAWQIFDEIRRTFKLAVCKGFIQQQQFPCYSKRITHPRNCLPMIRSSTLPEYYTIEQYKSLSENLGSDSISLMFRLALYAGLKREEIQALTASDYNPHHRTLSITKVLRWHDRSYQHFSIVPLPKTDRKRRTISLTLPAQCTVEKALEVAKISNVSETPEDCFLFRNRFGNPHTSAPLCTFAREIEQKSAIQHLSLRICRSTFIVLCFINDWSEADVQEYIGVSVPCNVLPYKKISVNNAAILMGP